VLLTYLVVVLSMMLFETWIVYPIPPVARGNWQPTSLEYEDVWFHSADGTKLHGWFVPHPTSNQAILYCHGNGEHVGDNANLAAVLRDELEASIFIFDYRGYGRSEGWPHEAGCIADGLAAQQWLAKRMGVEPNELVLMGRSLGSAVAVALAGEQGARALVLENSFPTMTDVAAYHYPWLPIRWAMDNRYDSLQRIQQYRGPLFQSHGTADRVIPIRLGRELFAASPGTAKRFVELPGHDHNDPPPARYHQQIKSFVEDAGGLPTAKSH